MKLHALTTILLSTTVVVATTLRGAILPSPHLANPSLLPPDTTLTLITSHAIHRTLLRADNTFVFRNLSAGSYLLETISSTHHFAPYRVDVSTHPSSISVSQTFRGNAWDNTGERLGALEVRAIGKKEYFIVREGFSPLKMLGSPMILIAIVSLASIIVLPKMLDKMDPEFKAEFEAQSRKRGAVGAGAENPLNFDVAGFLAGTGGGSAPSPQSGGAAGKAGKRR